MSYVLFSREDTSPRRNRKLFTSQTPRTQVYSFLLGLKFRSPLDRQKTVEWDVHTGTFRGSNYPPSRDLTSGTGDEGLFGGVFHEDVGSGKSGETQGREEVKWTLRE